MISRSPLCLTSLHTALLPRARVLGMTERRPERGVTTASQLLAKLQAQAPSSTDSIKTPFLDTLEQLCFYERPDLAPLLASLPTSLVTALALLLSSPPDVRHGRGLFTSRSLACYAAGRLSSLNAAAKFRILADEPQLPRLVLGGLDEQSPFSHVTALNVLVDWGGERAVIADVVAAGGVRRVVERYWHHDKVKITAEADADGREAQTAIKVFAISLLANIAQHDPHEPSLSADGAVEVALHIIHTEDHEPLLLPAIKLLYCLASASPQPACVGDMFDSLHIGELMALTTSHSPYLSNASKALLGLTSLGQRGRSGEAIGRPQLGEVEYARFEARMVRVKASEAAAAAVDEAGGESTASDSGRSGSSEQEVVKCGSCGKVQANGVTFAACGRCRKLRYCSKDCQTRHWKVHKAHCNKQ